MSARIEAAGSIHEIPAADWDDCAGTGNPFVRHAFLAALETSGSATCDTGWQPLHLCARDESGLLIGASPCYLKYHSYGEYIFDHGWASAFDRAGGRYYPKLLIAVPFTPATGPRLLVRPDCDADQVRQHLLAGAKALAGQLKLSSVHINFPPGGDLALGESAGFLYRAGQQFHWRNGNYASFDDFLAALSSRKRKQIRKERAEAVAHGIEVEQLTGADIKSHHWDDFYRFYRSTTDRKWGEAYLTRDFFDEIGRTMADRILLVMARRDGRYIAGAINFIGDEALFGRNWGAIEHHPCLHFELCYYQAIDFAIARGLARVEAGAQGEHKLARGYLPVVTHSLHWIADPGFRRAVARFLDEERAQIGEVVDMLEEHSPFRHQDEA